MSEDRKALQGLRVVECATVVAGPLMGRIMADFGAEVVHVEHPAKGDHLRHFGFTVFLRPELALPCRRIEWWRILYLL